MEAAAVTTGPLHERASRKMTDLQEGRTTEHGRDHHHLSHDGNSKTEETMTMECGDDVGDHDDDKKRPCGYGDLVDGSEEQGQDYQETTSPQEQETCATYYENNKKRPRDDGDGDSVAAGNDKQRQKQKTRRPRKKRQCKPLDMPKRPLTAYNLFVRDMRSFLCGTELNTDHKRRTTRRPHRRTHGKYGFKELTMIVSTTWQGLDDKARAPYKREAKVNRDRYDREVKLYYLKKRWEGAAYKQQQRQQQQSLSFNKSSAGAANEAAPPPPLALLLPLATTTTTAADAALRPYTRDAELMPYTPGCIEKSCPKTSHLQSAESLKNGEAVPDTATTAMMTTNQGEEQPHHREQGGTSSTPAVPPLLLQAMFHFDNQLYQALTIHMPKPKPQPKQTSSTVDGDGSSSSTPAFAAPPTEDKVQQQKERQAARASSNLDNKQLPSPLVQQQQRTDRTPQQQQRQQEQQLLLQDRELQQQLKLLGQQHDLSNVSNSPRRVPFAPAEDNKVQKELLAGASNIDIKQLLSLMQQQRTDSSSVPQQQQQQGRVRQQQNHLSSVSSLRAPNLDKQLLSFLMQQRRRTPDSGAPQQQQLLQDRGEGQRQQLLGGQHHLSNVSSPLRVPFAPPAEDTCKAQKELTAGASNLDNKTLLSLMKQQRTDSVANVTPPRVSACAPLAVASVQLPAGQSAETLKKKESPEAATTTTAKTQEQLRSSIGTSTVTVSSLLLQTLRHHHTDNNKLFQAPLGVPHISSAADGSGLSAPAFAPEGKAKKKLMMGTCNLDKQPSPRAQQQQHTDSNEPQQQLLPLRQQQQQLRQQQLRVTNGIRPQVPVYGTVSTAGVAASASVLLPPGQQSCHAQQAAAAAAAGLQAQQQQQREEEVQKRQQINGSCYALQQHPAAANLTGKQSLFPSASVLPTSNHPSFQQQQPTPMPTAAAAAAANNDKSIAMFRGTAAVGINNGKQKIRLLQPPSSAPLEPQKCFLPGEERFVRVQARVVTGPDGKPTLVHPIQILGGEQQQAQQEVQQPQPQGADLGPQAVQQQQQKQVQPQANLGQAVQQKGVATGSPLLPPSLPPQQQSSVLLQSMQQQQMQQQRNVSAPNSIVEGRVDDTTCCHTQSTPSRLGSGGNNKPRFEKGRDSKESNENGHGVHLGQVVVQLAATTGLPLPSSSLPPQQQLSVLLQSMQQQVQQQQQRNAAAPSMVGRNGTSAGSGSSGNNKHSEGHECNTTKKWNENVQGGHLGQVVQQLAATTGLPLPSSSLAPQQQLNVLLQSMQQQVLQQQARNAAAPNIVVGRDGTGPSLGSDGNRSSEGHGRDSDTTKESNENVQGGHLGQVVQQQAAANTGLSLPSLPPRQLSLLLQSMKQQQMQQQRNAKAAPNIHVVGRVDGTSPSSSGSSGNNKSSSEGRGSSTTKESNENVQGGHLGQVVQQQVATTGSPLPSSLPPRQLSVLLQSMQQQQQRNAAPNTVGRADGISPSLGSSAGGNKPSSEGRDSTKESNENVVQGDNNGSFDEDDTCSTITPDELVSKNNEHDPPIITATTEAAKCPDLASTREEGKSRAGGSAPTGVPDPVVHAHSLPKRHESEEGSLDSATGSTIGVNEGVIRGRARDQLVDEVRSIRERRLEISMYRKLLQSIRGPALPRQHQSEAAGSGIDSSGGASKVIKERKAGGGTLDQHNAENSSDGDKLVSVSPDSSKCSTAAAAPDSAVLSSLISPLPESPPENSLTTEVDSEMEELRRCSETQLRLMFGRETAALFQVLVSLREQNDSSSQQQFDVFYVPKGCSTQQRLSTIADVRRFLQCWQSAI